MGATRCDTPAARARSSAACASTSALVSAGATSRSSIADQKAAAADATSISKAASAIRASSRAALAALKSDCAASIVSPAASTRMTSRRMRTISASCASVGSGAPAPSPATIPIASRVAFLGVHARLSRSIRSRVGVPAGPEKGSGAHSGASMLETGSASGARRRRSARLRCETPHPARSRRTIRPKAARMGRCAKPSVPQRIDSLRIVNTYLPRPIKLAAGGVSRDLAPAPGFGSSE